MFLKQSVTFSFLRETLLQVSSALGAAELASGLFAKSSTNGVTCVFRFIVLHLQNTTEPPVESFTPFLRLQNSCFEVWQHRNLEQKPLSGDHPDH